MSDTRAYLDATSAAPMNNAARQALSAALSDGWADPKRLYFEGRRARLLVDAARQTIADVIGARPDHVFFTANHRSALRLAVTGRSRLAASAVEHSEILAVNPTLVPVDLMGQVNTSDFIQAARSTDLAALHVASVETGTRQPISEVREGLAGAVPLLTDANHAVGIVDLPDWDILVAGANGWGGPADVGLLAYRPRVRFTPPQLPEPSVPLAVAAAAGLLETWENRAQIDTRLRSLTERIRSSLPHLVQDIEVVGHPDQRLPHIVSFSCLYVDGEALVHELDRRDVAVASGSACTAEDFQPSHVLAAMGVLTGGNVRVSLPLDCSNESVDHFLRVLPDAVAAVREVLE